MNNAAGFTEVIEVSTGDQFCATNNIDEIDLLKIDTEGYEMPVLQGFSNMLKHSKINAVYCEVGFNPVNKKNTYINEVIDFANQNGFQFYGLYDLANFQISNGLNFGNILFLSNDIVKKLL